MNFSSAEKVLQTIRAGDDVDRIRQDNRVKITDAANFVPPLSEEEAKQMGVKINCNFGELAILLSHARRQYLTAFISNQHFFKVSLPFAPAEHQSEWEAFITQEINKPLRDSLSYFELHRSRWSSVVALGVGPMVWHKDDCWEPDFVAMSDLRIATDTTLDFKNLGWFAVRHAYTPMELLDKAFNGKKNNRWEKKSIAEILKNYRELNSTDTLNNYDWNNSPEKIHELWKQNGGFYSGDAMPSIPLWHFYFEDDTDPDNKGWFMRVVAENAVVKGEQSEKFLWKSDDPIAATLSQILHCQFGDLTNDAPFKYHSVRSLGFALLEPTFYTNLTRCRLLQHIHDNFNIWLRTSDPIDKARAQVQEFSNLGMLRAGITVVPRTERHQIDASLVEMGMAQLTQLKSEASSSYTQQPDTGTKKEQTAFETNVKMQQVNAMLGGLLMTAFKYETFAYREISRRFCLRKTNDPDIRRFQRRCKEAGIPRRFLDVELWDVEPVTPLGMGNPTIAQAAAQQLMAQRGAYDPTAQQEILHESTLVITGDARKAARWAPLGKGRGITEAQRDSMAMFGTLMTGVMIPVMEGLPVIDQIDAMIPLFASKIHMIEQRDNVGKPDEITGLQSVYQYLGELINRLAQNPEEKQRVKKYMDDIGQLWNQVKGLAQRGQEAAQKSQQNGNGHDPAAIAKAQSTLMLAKVKAKTTIDKAKLTDKQKSESFVRDQRRQDAKALADIQREAVKTRMKSLSSEGGE